MATVTRPTDALPDPGDALKAEPIRDHIANILTFIESNNIDSSNVDYSSTDGIMVLDQAQTVTGAKNFSTSILLSGSAIVDLNGIADSLVLDEDADTTISAPTDDQIDIEVGGSDLYKFTATAFVSGSNIVSDTTNTDSLGTTALTWSDLYLGDASVLAFGEDQDVTLTHDPDDGIFLNAGMKLGFRDMGGEYIYSVSDGTLGIAAATEVDITTTTLDVNGAVDISGATAIGGTLNVGASTAIANVKDEDNMSSNSATSLATQQSIKAYVDSQVAGADTLAELTDTNITSAADASMLLYDTGTSRWIDNVMSGDATMADTGAVTLAGTNTNLTTLANVTTVGTIGTGTWQGTKVASAYLDDQTAHLNGSQSFTGAKTFGAASQFNSTITVGADDAGYDVIFYGNTASANATWDTSADDLILSGAAGLIVPDGQLTLGSTAVTSTAAELNLIDGATSRGTTAVASGDGILINDAGTMRMTNVDTVSTYFSSHSVGGSNIVTVGTVSAGTWQGNKVASAYLDDQTAHLNATQSFTGAKTFGAATQFNSTVTVGANDAGYDVILYGNTASANVTWDASEDDLIANGAARIVVPDGQMVLGSTAISSTAAEINLLDALSRGSIIYGNASGATTVLTKGGSGTVLTSDGTDISWSAAAGGGHTIQEEGSGLTQRANLNFVGAGVTATDNSGADTTIVTIGASGASLPFTNSNGGSDAIALTSAAIGESLVTDTSPQLGGNLDVNGQSIVSDASNENIPITPHGTGSVVISKADINGGAIDGTAIGANSASTGAFTTIAASGTTTLSGDQVITDGNGLISGHTARVQVGWTTGENQILGTADGDANLSITRYSADNGPPNLFFGKSRGSLGANTIVADGDPLGRITFCGSDGVDMRSAAAWIEAECDGEFEANNVSGRIILATTPDSGGVQDPIERVRVTSDGYMRMAGAGIQFNGDTAAANALDDYEEGTFTPVLKYASTSYSASGSEGRYIKIGRLVWFSASITITNAAASNDSSTLSVTGMPYTIENNSPTGHARQICTIQYYTGGSTILNLVTYCEINTSNVNLLIIFNNGGSWQGVPSSHIYQSSNNNNVFLTGCYFAA